MNNTQTEITYTESEALSGKAYRDTYVGSVTIALPSGSIHILTGKCVKDAREIAVAALSKPSRRVFTSAR